MAKILVTGGTGFIGSHIATGLLELGHAVVIADNLSNSSKDALTGIKAITGQSPNFYEMDLSSEEKVFELFDKNKDLDAVIHLAALKAVGESVENPLLYYHNNLVSSINLFKAMEKFKVNYLLYSSSACVYGKPEYLPIDENHPLTDEAAPYGKTKSMTEEIIRDTSKAHESFKAISLRYFNPIGAHKSSLIGEAPKGVPANLTPYLNQVVAGVLPHLRVFGNDYDTVDGTGVRDYIHILDLLDAHIAALKRLLDNKTGGNYEVYNIGTGRGTSVLEMIKLFEEATGKQVPYEIYPRRPGDFDSIYNDASLAEQKLGWQSKHSIKEALLDGWNWEKKLRNIK